MAFVTLIGNAYPQANELFRSWNQPVKPFRIIGNLYYVGANDIASYLITTPEGLIVIDGGFPETVPIIVTGIQGLGFRLSDVKILLNSHAHFDHAGGLAELKRLTGASLFASREDSVLLTTGGKNDFHYGDEGSFPAVQVDRSIDDREEVRLGGSTLTARLTPGHTKGCTTWTMKAEEDGRLYDVVFVGSASVNPGYILVDNPTYPQIADDYALTFRVLKSLSCDVFLASHGAFFKLTEKVKLFEKEAEKNPFVDPEGYRAFVSRTQKRYLERLAEQQGQE